MGEKQSDSSRVLLGILALAVPFLPILYLLSVGPALALHKGGWISGELIQFFYHPVTVVYRIAPWSQPFFDWYVELF